MPPEWSIADVASHLGSQAEIFELFLTAGLSGEPAPGGEVFQHIWDRWNALSPSEQAAQSATVNAAFTEHLEQIPADEAQAFGMSMFGRDVDLSGVLAMRLGEHAVHTWDIAVALDASAKVSLDAVELLVDTLDAVAGRAGKPAEGGEPIVITTTDPQRNFVLTVAPEVSLTGSATPAAVADDPRVATARKVFPGF